MVSEKHSIFDYLEFHSFLSDRLREGLRGMQAHLAKRIGCQATYLIKVLRKNAHFTEDQAFKAGQFLGLSERELDYFLDLVRLDRAGGSETKKYLQNMIVQKAKTSQEVRNRVRGSSLESSLQSQLQYFSSLKPSMVHLGTLCSHLQKPSELSKALRLDIVEVRKILAFLQKKGLVIAESDGRYTYSGKMIHLSRDSPLHPSFQKLRREMALRRLDEKITDRDLHFSSLFVTSKSHMVKLRKELLRLIEEMDEAVAGERSEEIGLMVIDFFPVD